MGKKNKSMEAKHSKARRIAAQEGYYAGIRADISEGRVPHPIPMHEWRRQSKIAFAKAFVARELATIN